MFYITEIQHGLFFWEFNWELLTTKRSLSFTTSLAKMHKSI